MQNTRIILVIGITFALSSTIAVPAKPDADSPDAQTRTYLALGQQPVHVIERLMLHDSKRDLDVPLRVYFPEKGGPYPVIVFSHGAGDSNEAAPHLMRHWASHGYVCILPTHFYNPNALLQRSPARLVNELKAAVKIGAASWHARVLDVTLVMDSLTKLPELAPELAGKMDATRIGVAGHSYGAFTTELVAGTVAVDATTGARLDYSDPRPRAFILVSGQGRDPRALLDDSWEKVTRPMLVMGGSRDVSPALYPGTWRMEPYEFSPPGDKYSLFIEGANHISYIGPIIDRPMHDPGDRGPVLKTMRAVSHGMARIDPGLDQTGIFEYSRIATVAFWDAYLKDDKAAKEYLRSDALAAYSHKTLELKWK